MPPGFDIFSDNQLVISLDTEYRNGFEFAPVIEPRSERMSVQYKFGQFFKIVGGWKREWNMIGLQPDCSAVRRANNHFTRVRRPNVDRNGETLATPAYSAFERRTGKGLCEYQCQHDSELNYGSHPDHRF